MSKAPKEIHVLVVEDELSLNQAYVTILKSAGIKVDACFNGKEALDLLKTVSPDIILLDLRMPKMDGLEFLTLFSKLKPKKSAKVIIFSNYDKQDEITQAFDLGASKYLLKAWASPKELVQLVKETIES